MPFPYVSHIISPYYFIKNGVGHYILTNCPNVFICGQKYDTKKRNILWKSDENPITWGHVASHDVISCTRFLSKLWCMKLQWSLICNKGCLMPIMLAEAEVCALISGCYCPLLIDTSHYGYYFALGNLHSGGHKPAFWGPLPLSLKFNLAICSQQDWYPQSGIGANFQNPTTFFSDTICKKVNLHSGGH